MAVPKTREEFREYILNECKNNDYVRSEEDIEHILDIVAFFGTEMYRPIINLLLANYDELQARIASYSSEALAPYEKLAKAIDLDAKSIALIQEVMEGADTKAQHPKAGRQLTEAELRYIRRRIQKEDEEHYNNERS